MAAAREVEKELAIALKEIGRIKPTFDEETNSWVFSHKLYPVECDGVSPKAVKERYPLYLKEFIRHRLENRLDKLVESRTHGQGGRRPELIQANTHAAARHGRADFLQWAFRPWSSIFSLVSPAMDGPSEARHGRQLVPSKAPLRRFQQINRPLRVLQEGVGSSQGEMSGVFAKISDQLCFQPSSQLFVFRDLSVQTLRHKILSSCLPLNRGLFQNLLP